MLVGWSVSWLVCPQQVSEMKNTQCEAYIIWLTIWYEALIEIDFKWMMQGIEFIDIFWCTIWILSCDSGSIDNNVGL